MANQGAVQNVGKFWSMGDGTHKIPLSLYLLNRQRLSSKIPEGSVIVLQGGVDVPFNDTDVDHVFRQESFFTWACGVREPGCYLFITGSVGTSYLFVPRLPESYAVWMGRLHTTNDFQALYGVDHVYYTDQAAEILKSLKPSKVLVLHGKNSDSGLTTRETKFDGIEKFEIDKTTLYPILAELRVTKTDLEIEAMRYVVKVSSEAHKKVMLYIKPGRTEYQCESVFLHHCYGEGGCRHVSYTCICGSGANGAVLHYGHAGAPNAKLIQDGDMCLFDMGANYGGYAADITCSFPANGKFTEDQKLIYNAVLAARTAVIKSAFPGVSWKDMHLLANRVMLQYLIDGNLLIGNVDDMMKDNINCILQPHGLGHLLGLDVHDVGGYLEHCPPRPDPPLSSLRTTRVLEAGMVLTVEPGCYFIDALLDKALANPNQAKYFNKEYLQKFRNFGGVRIEDNVLITENGAEDLTQVPRTVEEIEEFMSKGANF